MRRAAHQRVRLYQTLRTAHLERLRELPVSSVLYRDRRYDFDAALADGLDLVQAGGWATARILLRSPVTGLEINEPLMLSSLRRTALALVAVGLRRRLTRRPVTVVTYAIGNDDPFRPPQGPGLRGALRRRLDRALVAFVARRVDRVAFGTSAARDLYARLVPQLAAAESALVPALPAPCACLAASDGVRDRDAVLFLGAFDGRKGLRLLAAAWPRVREQWPDARLTLVGKGPLLGLAEELAAGRPEVDLVVDPPRPRIHEALRSASVVVLASQRTPTWREQVGLPLVEGLAHGCAVVTTTETGLAEWLAADGHRVVDADAGPDVLAAAIVASLAEGRSRDSVLAALPAADGRLAADAWMFSS